MWRAEQGMVVATEDGFRSELGGIAARNATLGVILAAFWLSNLNGRILGDPQRVWRLSRYSPRSRAQDSRD